MTRVLHIRVCYMACAGGTEGARPWEVGWRCGARLHGLVVGELEGAQHGRLRDDDQGVAFGQVEHRRDRTTERGNHIRRSAEVVAHTDDTGLPAKVKGRDVGRRKRRRDELLFPSLGAEDGVRHRTRRRPTIRAQLVEAPLVVDLGKRDAARQGEGAGACARGKEARARAEPEARAGALQRPRLSRP